MKNPIIYTNYSSNNEQFSFDLYPAANMYDATTADKVTFTCNGKPTVMSTAGTNSCYLLPGQSVEIKIIDENYKNGASGMINSYTSN